MKDTEKKSVKYGVFGTAVIITLGVLIYAYLSKNNDNPDHIPAFSLEGMEPQVIEKIENIVNQVKAQPEDDELWGLLGMNLQVHARQRQAVICYQEAYWLNSNDFRWAYLSGYTLDELNEGEPLNWYRKALAIDSSYAPLYVRIGKQLLANKQQDEAEKAFQKALFHDEKLSHAYIGLAQIEYHKGQIASAIQYAEKALSLNAEHRDAYSLLINCYRKLGDQKIVRYYSRKMEGLPAIVLMNEHIFQILSAEGVSSAWYRKRGKKLMERGFYVQAEKELKTALEIRPAADIHQNLGIVLTRLNKTEEAISHFRQAVGLKPGNAEYLSNLGTALCESGNFEEGITYLQQAFELDPGYEHACLNLAITYQKREQWREAVAIYKRGLAAVPDNLVLSFGLAWLLATSPDAHIRNGREALQLAENLVRKSKYKNARVLDVWGAAHAETGDFEKAEQIEEKAIELLQKRENEPLLYEEMKRRLQGYRKRQPWRIGN